MPANRRTQRTQGTAAALLAGYLAPQFIVVPLSTLDRVAGVDSAILSICLGICAVLALCAIPVLFVGHRLDDRIRRAAAAVPALSALACLGFGLFAAVHDGSAIALAVTIQFLFLAAALAVLAYRLETVSRAPDVPAPSPEQRRADLRRRFAELKSRREK